MKRRRENPAIDVSGLLLWVVVIVPMAACSDQSGRLAVAQVAGGGFGAAEVSASSVPGITVRRLTTTDWGYFPYSSISPDGRYMTRVDWSTFDLAVEDLETGTVHHLTHNERGEGKPHQEAARSVFSRDGGRIAFTWFNPVTQVRALDFEIDRTGFPRVGEPEILFDNPERNPYFPFNWSPDGRSLLVKVYPPGMADQLSSNQLAVISMVDGAYRALKSFDWRQPEMAVFSPDGEYVAYDMLPEVDSPNRDVFVLSLDGVHDTRVVGGPTNDRLLGWHPDGGILFHSDRAGTPGIWRVQISNGRPAGPPELVQADVWNAQPLGFVGDDFYYGVNVGSDRLYVAPIDLATGYLTGAPVPVTDLTGTPPSSWDWSPNGQLLAYWRRGESRGQGSVIVVTSPEGDELNTIPLDLTASFQLRWLPDGKSLIVFARDPKGRNGFHRIDLESGSYRTILRVDQMEYPIPPAGHFAVSPDGNTLYFGRHRGETGVDARPELVSYDLEDDVYRSLALVSWSAMVAVSPDGARLLVVVPRETETGEMIEVIGILSLADGRFAELYDVPDGFVESGLEWAPDGQSVMFMTSPAGETESVVWSVPAAGGTPRVIEFPNAPFWRLLRLRPDGRSVAFRASEGGRGEIWVMEGLGDGLTIANQETSQ